MLAQEERIIVNASRTLYYAEINYPITEKECLAVVWALEKFRPYYNEKPIKMITDHKALKHMTTGKNLSAKMVRRTLRMVEFNTRV